MRSSAANIQVTSFDDLFQSGGGNGTDSGADRVQELPLDKLVSFHDHPFQVRDDEEMQKIVESVALHGVLVPCLCANPISTQRQNHFPFQGFTSDRRGTPQKFPLCQLPPQNWVASVSTFAEVNKGESLCFQGF